MSKLSGDWDQIVSEVGKVDFELPTSVPANMQTHYLTQTFLTNLFDAFKKANESWNSASSVIIDYAKKNNETEEVPVPEIM